MNKEKIKISGNQLQIGNTVYQLEYKVLDYITNLQKKNNKQKEVLDKALYWLSENTHYTDFNVDKLVLDENVNLKELLELLEEIE